MKIFVFFMNRTFLITNFIIFSDLLAKLLPHEISKYVIETLETRLEN